MIRLRDILAMDIFRNFKIIAGKNGSDREVKTVSVMDAPDIYKWMKGGEFLITSGYVVKDQPEYLAFLIENLDKHGACALGIKLDRFIYEYPQDAIEKANKLNFPIIAIPFEFAFTDVINPVLQEVINHQSRILQYSERVHQACTKMVLEDEDISTILSFLEEHIHQEAAFVDTCFDKTYYTKDTAQGGIEETGRYRIHINEEEYGYLVFGSKWNDYDESFRDYYQIAIEQAGTILILKLQKKLTARQIEADYREQFVQDMLTRNINSKEEIINRAMIYNWDFYLGGVVFIVDIDHFKKQYLKHLDENVNRRMMEMMEAYANNEEFKAMFANMKPDETLVLNKNNKLVKALLSMAGKEEKKEDATLLCHQLYDLALMSHRPLTSEEMTAFIDRSNLLLEKLTAFEA